MSVQWTKNLFDIFFLSLLGGGSSISVPAQKAEVVSFCPRLAAAARAYVHVASLLDSMFNAIRLGCITRTFKSLQNALTQMHMCLNLKK